MLHVLVTADHALHLLRASEVLVNRQNLANQVIARAQEMRKDAAWASDRRTTLRRGQALFNALQEIDPDTAAEIRGTDDDPFYDDGKILRFWAKVWQKEESDG